MKGQSAAAVSAINIRAATQEDIRILEDLSAETFYQSCAHTTLDNITAHMVSAFTEEQLLDELKDSSSVFLLAFMSDKPAGYAKLRKNRQPVRKLSGKAIEIHRLYVLQQMLGKQIGKTLMETCLSIAKREAYDVAWLGVCKKNLRAIAFYKHWGFEIFGSSTFRLGEESQTDYLMKKELK